MPKTKQRTPKGTSTSSNTAINDPRFTDFATDPRYRLPSKKYARTVIDKRFSRIFTDDGFSSTAKVDRYGRKLSSSGKKKALERLYLPDGEEAGKAEASEAEADEEEKDKDVEVESDGGVEKEVKHLKAGYDAARGGGFSSSEDEEEEEDNDEDGGVEIDEAAFPDLQAQAQAVEMGEVSSRIAVVNLDWDNIRSADLYAVFASFVRPGGKIHKISIYQSEFGKERMEREELEGPPKEIFARTQEEEVSELDSEDSEDDEEADERIKKDLLKEDDGQGFDSAALRQYQLERLRYYYAVVVCSDDSTAQAIYEATDGSEYLSTANFFDLRFIPEGTEFDDKPRDECESVPSGYRPTEFVTHALQHSKVKLTWDMNPEEGTRKNAINKAFSGSRAEIGENDLRAYLGSDSESGASEGEVEAVEEDAPKLSKKELQRQKMRAALGLGDEPAPSKKISGPVGDMEITFTAGLSSNTKGSVFENEPIIEESTAERYVRLEKERKARRKERSKAKREGRDPDTVVVEDVEEAGEAEKEDLGFDDPFFAVNEAVKEQAAKGRSKEERRKRRELKQAEAEAKALNRAELELLMQDNSTETAPHLDHFDINEIARAEKAAKKGSKKYNKTVEGSKRGGLQKSFEMDVEDPRFGKLYESHEFAIDPSNPKFKATEGMKKLLEEGRRKRGAEGYEEVKTKKVKVDKGEKGELSGLVESIKKNSKRQASR